MPSNLIANRPRIGYVLPVRFDGDRVVDKSEPSDFLRLDGQCSALFFFLLLVFIFEKPFSPPRGGGEANGTSVFIADLKRTGPNKQLRFLLFLSFSFFSWGRRWWHEPVTSRPTRGFPPVPCRDRALTHERARETHVRIHQWRQTKNRDEVQVQSPSKEMIWKIGRQLWSTPRR